jgi:hypothetical protein
MERRDGAAAVSISYLPIFEDSIRSSVAAKAIQGLFLILVALEEGGLVNTANYDGGQWAG